MLNAQKSKVYQLNSPDSAIVLKITVGTKLQWSVEHRGQVIIAPSAISLLLNDGEVLGNDAKIVTVKTEKTNTSFSSINSKKWLFLLCNQVRKAFNSIGEFGKH
jgi:alpha-glucosidase